MEEYPVSVVLHRKMMYRVKIDRFPGHRRVPIPPLPRPRAAGRSSIWFISSVGRHHERSVRPSETETFLRYYSPDSYWMTKASGSTFRDIHLQDITIHDVRLTKSVPHIFVPNVCNLRGFGYVFAPSRLLLSPLPSLWTRTSYTCMS